MKWRTIETAPKDGSEFLGYWAETEEDANNAVRVTTWWMNGLWHNPYQSSDNWEHPTHWRPEFEPPK